jgi:probable F420-dependent oxidoreductase
VRFSMWIWPYARWGGLQQIGRAARRLEQLGFHSVTVSDHTVSPAGAAGAALGSNWPDWAVLSAHLADVTTRLRIVSCVVIPYRHPVTTAKQIATLDQLSGGRFALAACVGWWQREFELLGVDFACHGALTDAHLEQIRSLWTEPQDGFEFAPRCAQRPHVPILIAGGDGARPRERVLRFGDGWMPMGEGALPHLAQTIATLKEGAAARGRDPQAMQFRYTVGIGEAERALTKLSEDIAAAGGGIVSLDPRRTATLAGAPEQMAAQIHAYAQAGFTELTIQPAGDSYEDCMERVEAFAADVLPLVSSS